MSEDVSVTQWLKLAREGDEQAIERLWSQYFDKLVRVASSQMGELRRAYDGEDAALGEMHRVIELDPDHAGALNYVGFTWAERGERLEEAEAMIRRARRPCGVSSSGLG